MKAVVGPELVSIGRAKYFGDLALLRLTICRRAQGVMNGKMDNGRGYMELEHNQTIIPFKLFYIN